MTALWWIPVSLVVAGVVLAILCVIGERYTIRHAND